MKPTDSTSDAWIDCPPGELTRMVDRIQANRARRVTAQSVMTVAVVLIAAATAWQFYPGGDNSFGQITCTEVQAGLPDYIAGKLPAERAERFRLHLDHCGHCKELLEQMSWSPAEAVADAPLPRPVILADASAAIFHPVTHSAHVP